MIPALVGTSITSNTKTSGTTLTFAPGIAQQNVFSGNLLVLSILFDNAATASEPTVTSISVPTGETNSWQQVGAARSTSTSAGSFASGELWYLKMSVDWSVGGGSVTVTVNTAVPVRALRCDQFSGVQGVARSTAGTNYSTTTTAASASTTGTTPVTNDLAIGCIFGSNVAAVQAGSSDTTAGSWSTPAGFGTTGSGAASNNYGLFQYKVLTSGSQQTYANSAAMTAGNGAIVGILKSIPEPAIVQTSYRFYADGTESGSTALANQDTAYSADVSSGDVSLFLRTLLQQGTDAGGSTDDYQLQYELNNNGSWINVADAIFDRYTSGTTTVGTEFYGRTAISQSINGVSGRLTRVDISFTNTLGTPGSATFQVDLYAHSGTFGTSSVPTGTSLATSTTIDGSEIDGMSGSTATYTFYFKTPYLMTAGTKYCIVISTSSAGDVSNHRRLQHGTSGSITSGNIASYTSPTWTPTANDNMRFTAYNDSHAMLYTSRGITVAGTYNIQTTGHGESFSIQGNGTKLLVTRHVSAKVGSPTGTSSMAVYTHTGTFGTNSVPSGSALHTSTNTIDLSTYLTTNRFYEYVYDGTYTLTNGTYYCIVVAPSAASATNYITSPYIGNISGGNRASGAISGMTADSANDSGMEIATAAAATITPTTNINHLAATTSRLTGGTGSFVAGKFTQTGEIANFAWTASNNTEFLFGIQLKSSQLTNGDVLKFRVVRNGAPTTLTYSVTPTINISGGGAAPGSVKPYIKAANPAVVRASTR